MSLPLHYFTTAPLECLNRVLEHTPHDRTFTLIPRGCRDELCRVMPGVSADLEIDDAESRKDFGTLQQILSAMLDKGLTRKSLVICIGGGVTTDIGGLAAALYMRGVRYINIPTTLLAMVDASSGGKTAIDFGGVKNCVGAFHQPLTTIISPCFLESLPAAQILSGWAEMFKHGLLQADTQLFNTDPLQLSPDEWLPLIRESVNFKQSIVDSDPQELGLRRILNLGHTAGHAFEMLALKRGADVTHGQAVAEGLVTALILSVIKTDYSSMQMQSIAAAIKNTFPPILFDCKDYPQLLSLMHRDKKNQGNGLISFTLLDAAGHPSPGIPVSDTEATEALDITRDLLAL